MTKTLAIGLSLCVLVPGTSWAWPIELQSVSAFTRYLNIQVGSTSGTEQTWSLAVSKIRTRLRLASHKTLTVEQQAKVALQ